MGNPSPFPATWPAPICEPVLTAVAAAVLGSSGATIHTELLCLPCSSGFQSNNRTLMMARVTPTKMRVDNNLGNTARQNTCRTRVLDQIGKWEVRRLALAYEDIFGKKGGKAKEEKTRKKKKNKKKVKRRGRGRRGLEKSRPLLGIEYDVRSGRTRRQQPLL